MGWLERVKRNAWVDLYGEFDEKGNDIKHVRILPEDLDRLIAIVEGCIMRGKVNNLHCCPICERAPVYKDENYHAQNCPYHEDWKP